MDVGGRTRRPGATLLTWGPWASGSGNRGLLESRA